MSKQPDPKADTEGTTDNEVEYAWREAWAKSGNPTEGGSAYDLARQCWKEGANWGIRFERYRRDLTTCHDPAKDVPAPQPADKWTWTGQWTTTQPTATRVLHRCPVCNGHGVVAWQQGIAEVQSFSKTPCGQWPCNACGGKGVLWS